MPSFNDIEVRSNSKFFKVESGKPAVIRLLSDSPDERTVHGFGKEEIECTGEGCFKCQDGSDAKQRWSISIYNHETKRAAIWEFGAGVCKLLKGVCKTFAAQEIKITDVDLMVDATGEKLTKKYQITPMMKSKPVPEDVEVPF